MYGMMIYPGSRPVNPLAIRRLAERESSPNHRRDRRASKGRAASKPAGLVWSAAPYTGNTARACSNGSLRRLRAQVTQAAASGEVLIQMRLCYIILPTTCRTKATPAGLRNRPVRGQTWGWSGSARPVVMEGEGKRRDGQEAHLVRGPVIRDGR